MSPEAPNLVGDAIVEGMAKVGESRSTGRFRQRALVRISMGDDLEACRDALRPELALYIGGMGARGKNFYND